MDTKHFNIILKNPLQLKLSDLPLLNDLIKEYPYFQVPRAIRLKSLKEQKSHSYNTELKQTAAYTVDRGVLFDFITSEIKEPEKESIQTKNISPDIFIEAVGDNSSVETLDLTNAEATQIIDPFLFEEKTEENTHKVEIDINAPLEFSQEEKHSFAEWLKLASFKPIVRENTEPEIEQEIETSNKHTEITPEVTNNTTSSVENIPQNIVKENNESSTKKSNIESSLIDNFLKNNPKISPVKKDTPNINLATKNIISPEDLMTETLAKVYIAQKNYKKAIQAYKILSLKNPEKSGLFADQIRAIKKLQNNK